MAALSADQLAALRALIEAHVAGDPQLSDGKLATLISDQTRVPLRLAGADAHPASLVSVVTQVPCELVRAKLMELEPATWARIVMCRENQPPPTGPDWTGAQRILAVAVHEWLRYQPHLSLGRADVRAQLDQFAQAFGVQAATKAAILSLARSTVSEAEELGLASVSAEDVIRAREV